MKGEGYERLRTVAVWFAGENTRQRRRGGRPTKARSELWMGNDDFKEMYNTNRRHNFVICEVHRNLLYNLKHD